MGLTALSLAIAGVALKVSLLGTIMVTGGSVACRIAAMTRCQSERPAQEAIPARS